MGNITCNKCLFVKERNLVNFRKNRRVCRVCEREEARARSFLLERGITHEQRDNLLERQGGHCSCCGTAEAGSKKGWHVDHCHSSGDIRSVLCATCNIALGQVNDSIPRLQMLIIYLEKHGAKRATTIPKGSTPEADAGGNGKCLTAKI